MKPPLPRPPRHSFSLREKLAALGLSKDFRLVFWVMVIFSAVSNLLMLSVPLYMLQIYDRVLVSQSVETLVVLTLIVVFALLVFSILDASRSQLQTRVGARLDQAVTKKVTSTFLNLPRLAGDDNTTALRDVETMKRFVSSPAVGVFFDAPWAPFFLAIVYLMHPYLGGIAFFTAVILIFFAYLSDRVSTENSDSGLKKLLDAKKLAESSIRAPDVVASMGMGDAVSSRVQELGAQGLLTQTRQSDVISVFGSLSRFIRMMAQVGILGVGAWLVLQQEITAGVMIAASLIMGRGLAPAEKLIGSLRGSVHAVKSFNNLSRFLINEGDSGDAKFQTGLVTGDWQLKGIEVRYPQAREPALAGLDLTITKGQAVGVIGPNAAGKSTLARVLVGAMKPGKGTVRCGETDYELVPRRVLGQAIGYLPQDIKLLDASIHDNISRFRNDDPEQVIELAKLVGLHDVILNLPEGYDTVLGAGGAQLSGGQSQLLALARALYGKPELVVLDEPNANLDNVGDEAIDRVVKHCKNLGSAIVVISHKPTIMQHLDKLCLLQNGKIQLSGPPEEIHKKLVSKRPVIGQPSPGKPRQTPGKPSVSYSVGTGFGGLSKFANSDQVVPGKTDEKDQQK